MSAFSPGGFALLKAMEGNVPFVYDDAHFPPRPYVSGTPKGGTLTIGVGHTGIDAYPGIVWTQAQIDHALANDLTPPCLTVGRLVEKGIGLSNNQFSACVCLAFNIGVSMFAGSSVLRAILDFRPDDVPADFELFKYVGHAISPGLIGRRAAEVALWELPDNAPIPDFAAIRDAAEKAWRASNPAAAA